MTRKTFITAACIALAATSSVALGQISLVQPTDAIIPIDLDEPGMTAGGSARCGQPGDTFESCSPDAEEAWLAFDANDLSKYLNFGRENSGFIITPAGGPGVVQSFQMVSGNDAVERDPASWELFGTNDAIQDVHHGTGQVDNWTLIASGDDAGINTDPGRNALGVLQSFSNTTQYSSFKMNFPTVRDVGSANSMQFSEIEFYSNMDGTGKVTSNGFPAPNTPEPTANVLAFWERTTTGGMIIPASSSPGAEGPEFSIDGTDQTKYLNFGKDNSGVIVTLAGGAATVADIRFTTANDAAERDPINFEIHGTNDTIVTEAHGQGIDENWTLISSGETGLAGLDRFVQGPTVDVDATSAYSSFRITFPNTYDLGADGLELVANSMQIAEIELFGEFGGNTGLACDFDGDGNCDQDDINQLYSTNPTGAQIDTWLSQASSADNSALGSATDVLVVGDADLSGEVTSADLGLLLNNFGGVGGPAATWLGGDLNASGDVTSADLGLLLNNFGFTSASAAAVPEPSSIALFGFGLLGLLARRRR